MLYIKQGKHLTKIGTEANEEGYIRNGVGLHHRAIGILKDQKDLEGFIKGLPVQQAGVGNEDIPNGAEVYVLRYDSDWHPGREIRVIFYVDGDDVVITESGDGVVITENGDEVVLTEGGDGSISYLMTVKTNFADLKAALATL